MAEEKRPFLNGEDEEEKKEKEEKKRFPWEKVILLFLLGLLGIFVYFHLWGPEPEEVAPVDEVTKEEPEEVTKEEPEETSIEVKTKEIVEWGDDYVFLPGEIQAPPGVAWTASFEMKPDHPTISWEGEGLWDMDSRVEGLESGETYKYRLVVVYEGGPPAKGDWKEFTLP